MAQFFKDFAKEANDLMTKSVAEGKADAKTVGFPDPVWKMESKLKTNATDKKVVVNPTAESAAKVRVIAEFAVRDHNDPDNVARHITTIGVNENIVDASWQAIADAFRYHLVETTATVGV